MQAAHSDPLTGDALRQLRGADDVGELQPSAGPQRSRCRGEHPRLVGREVDHPIRDHAIEARRLGGRPLDVPGPEVDVAKVAVNRQAPGLGELLLGHVDTDHPPIRPRGKGRQEAVGAGAAAKVEYRLTRFDRRQVEE
jgi:hypothetical protein